VDLLLADVCFERQSIILLVQEDNRYYLDAVDPEPHR